MGSGGWARDLPRCCSWGDIGGRSRVGAGSCESAGQGAQIEGIRRRGGRVEGANGSAGAEVGARQSPTVGWRRFGGAQQEVERRSSLVRKFARRSDQAGASRGGTRGRNVCNGCSCSRREG
jgi:hypothetical protein